jgi:O-antigen ligase
MSGRVLPVAVGTAAQRVPVGTQVATTLGPIVLGVVLGMAVAQGNTALVAAAAVGLGGLALALLRPETLLIGWFAAILVNGRWLTYHQVGPLYVTEPLLALLVFAVVVRTVLSPGAQARSLPPRAALRFLVALNVVMLVPALAGLAFRTSSVDFTTGRNLLLVLYPLFALIIVSVTDMSRSYRQWFAVAVAGPALALALVLSGHSGGAENTTSTGAIRIAAFTFPLAFGIAPIVLIAAAREGLLKPLWAGAFSLPFLVALLFVNHRSAWLAFIAAVLILFSRRLSPAVVVAALAVVVVGFIVLTHSTSGTSTFSEEVTRAKSVTSTTDPNARFRLNFWKAAMEKSVRSPLFGNGFDLYPESIVPSEEGNYDPFPAPHNSFVAIAYRIGLIPFLIVLAMLLSLIRQGFRASNERSTPHDRAICAALTAIVVYTGVTSAFNVFLEAPYAGPLFWCSVGLLTYAIYCRPEIVRRAN